MKYIFAFLFTFLAFSHATHANVSPFKIENKETQNISKTSANVLAEVLKVPPSTTEVTAAGFFYGKKGTNLTSSSPSSLTLLSATRRTFGSILNNLTCGTTYEFRAYIQYGTGPKTEYSDTKEFVTLACVGSSNVPTITELAVKNIKKDSADVALGISNTTPYDSVSTFEFREGTQTEFTEKPEKLAVAKTGSGKIIIPLQNLKTDISYTYRIKTQFVLPPTGPNSGPNIVSRWTSPQDAFRTTKTDGTSGSTGGVEDSVTLFTIQTASSPTPAANDALLSASIQTTNTYTNTRIQTWFRFREKGKTAWSVSSFSGKEITVGTRDFTHTFRAVSADGVSCAQYGSDAINLGKIPENAAVIGTTALVKIKNVEYEFQGMGQYLSKLQSNPAYACAPITPGTGASGGSGEVKGDNTYTLITPLPLSENGSDLVTDVQIGNGSIVDLFNRIFTLMLIVVIVLAVVFMIIGGARYATGDSLGGKMGGREIIENAIKGLLFALLAWLLLNLINPDLLRFSLELENKGQKTGSSTPSTGGSILTGDGCGVGVSDEECFNRILADEPRVRALLTAEGIGVNVLPCTKFGDSGCTHVGLLNATTLQNIIKLKKDCVTEKPLCKMIVTGGTEYWLHGSGGNHKKFTAVDLRISGDPGVNIFSAFVRSKQKINTLTFCNETFAHANLRLCDEKSGDPHWHVDTLVVSSGQNNPSSNLMQFKNIGINNAGVWGKASGQPITNGQVQALVTSAKTKDWYSKVQQIAGKDAKILTAIIMIESSGNTNETRTEPDGRKSCGLGQVLTDTAKTLEPNTFRGKTVEDMCTLLKNPDIGIRLSYAFYRSLTGEFKIKVASYNGGPGRDNGPRGVSIDCPGLTRFECPWDSSGCYDQTKPNDKPVKTDCAINDGYEVTRFYVDKVKRVSDGL